MLFQIQAEENVYDLGKELSASKSKTLQYRVPVVSDWDFELLFFLNHSCTYIFNFYNLCVLSGTYRYLLDNKFGQPSGSTESVIDGPTRIWIRSSDIRIHDPDP